MTYRILVIVTGLQKPEVEETQARRRRQPQDTPEGVLLPVYRVLGEEATLGTVHRHHHHPPRRELLPGQQGQREDRADDSHRRVGVKGVVPNFATGPYRSCGPELGPPGGVAGSAPVTWSPKRPWWSILCKLTAMDFQPASSFVSM